MSARDSKLWFSRAQGGAQCILSIDPNHPQTKADAPYDIDGALLIIAGLRNLPGCPEQFAQVAGKVDVNLGVWDKAAEDALKVLCQLTKTKHDLE